MWKEAGVVQFNTLYYNVTGWAKKTTKSSRKFVSGGNKTGQHSNMIRHMCVTVTVHTSRHDSCMSYWLYTHRYDICMSYWLYTLRYDTCMSQWLYTHPDMTHLCHSDCIHFYIWYMYVIVAVFTSRHDTCMSLWLYTHRYTTHVRHSGCIHIQTWHMYLTVTVYKYSTI